MYVEEVCLTNIRKFNNKKIKLKKGLTLFMEIMDLEKPQS